MKGAILASLVAIAYAATGVFIYRNCRESDEERAIHQRADRVFAYDREFQHQLPLNELASLSIALEFGNYDGAKTLLDHLEPLVSSPRRSL